MDEWLDKDEYESLKHWANLGWNNNPRIRQIKTLIEMYEAEKESNANLSAELLFNSHAEKVDLKYDKSLEVIVGLSNDIRELNEIVTDRTNDIIHQQKEIEQLKEKLQAKELLDKNTKTIIKQYAKKVKHLFPLENTAGYGQLCDLVLRFEKALKEIQETYIYGLPDYNGEVMIDMDDTAESMYQIALKATENKPPQK